MGTNTKDAESFSEGIFTAQVEPRRSGLGMFGSVGTSRCRELRLPENGSEICGRGDFLWTGRFQRIPWILLRIRGSGNLVF